MNAITSCLDSIRETFPFSEMGEPIMRLIESTREYGVYFFSLGFFCLGYFPLTYKMNVSGPKRYVSASLSIKFKKWLKRIPFSDSMPFFKTWKPYIKINVSFGVENKDKKNKE